ncbi:MAG: hypothetical protein ACP5IT_06340 [Thermoproteota archaeon]|jgi:DNA-binding CsgD family transcriptional regulator
MVLRSKLKRKQNHLREGQSKSITLTEAQFQELKQLLESHLKVAALGALQDLTKTEIEKNTWLLHTAGFSQDAIRRILHVSKKTVNQILSGKYVSPKRQKREEK